MAEKKWAPPPFCNCQNNPLLVRQCPKCSPYSGGPPSYYGPPSHYQPNHYPSAPPQPSIGHSNSYPASHYPGRPTPPGGYRPSPQNSVPSRGGVRPYYWVDTFSHGGVPSTALLGGHDIDGAQIYVGRAFHEGDWIPAKVIPEKSVAYVAYGGAEHAKHQYQVLCEQRFDWVPSSGGHVPPGAVEGGRTSDGETLYVGRVHHDGAVTIGKVQPSHGVCYIPFDGREVAHGDYEILILRN